LQNFSRVLKKIEDMNSIDLFKHPRFPLSTETIDFLQQMAVMMSNAAGIGGTDFILSGCVETGSNISTGFIVVAGEVLPFVGGTKETYIVIEETKRSVTAEGQVYEGIYISRQARFGTGSGQVAWSIFQRISIPDIYARIAAIIPPGVIVMWSGTVAPEGWHLCDGNDETPDLTGKFIVGQSSIDGDFFEIGFTGGQKKVALTVEQLPPHSHTYNDQQYDATPNGTSGWAKPGSLKTGTSGSTGQGYFHENLPPFFVLAYIIKR
jgi:microcystin-dependent protein